MRIMSHASILVGVEAPQEKRLLLFFRHFSGRMNEKQTIPFHAFIFLYHIACTVAESWE